MTGAGFTLFDTPIGRCGIAWSERGIVAAQLPEADDGATRARLARRVGVAAVATPPPDVQRAIERIRALLSGAKDDLADIALDLAAVPDFNREVYAIARTVLPGETCTYGDIAKRLGDLTLSRAVGQAMGQNPFPPIVPCHRVLAAGWKTGGFSAPGGVETKLKMLAIEGAAPGGQMKLL
jgi:methylated-DNA-[protein]-cysteine S-methyltransferase